MQLLEDGLTAIWFFIDERNTLITGSIIVLSFLIGLIGLLPLFGRQGEEDPKIIMRIGLRKLTAISLIILLGLQLYHSSFLTHTLELPNVIYLFTAITAWVFGKVLYIYYYRYLAPQINNYFAHKRTSQMADEISDMRTEIGRIQQVDFDPTEYYKEGYLFRGLSEQHEPVYDSWQMWKDNHEAVIGPSQTGKGVNIGVQLDQAIRNNHCAIFVDPKPDKYCRAIMQKACADSGREFIEVDLNGVCKTERYNLTASGSTQEVRNRLMRLTELEAKGSDADHYKRQERRVLDRIIRENGIRSIKRILTKARLLNAQSRKNEPLGTTDAALTEIADLVGICDKKGLNLRRAILENKVIYLRSSTTDDRVKKITKAFIDDLIDCIPNTDIENGGQRAHHVFVVIDEVKFLVTQLLSNALAALKGSNCHILIAYQSRLDIRNTDDQSLDKDSIETSINVNTTTKLCYMAAENDTAEWVAEETGKINKKIADREKLETNAVGGEIMTGERHLQATEEQTITANVVKALPPRCAVLLQPARLAGILKTSWVTIDLDLFKPTRYRQGEVKPSTILDEVENEEHEQITTPDINKTTGKAIKQRDLVDITQVLRDMKERKKE